MQGCKVGAWLFLFSPPTSHTPSSLPFRPLLSPSQFLPSHLLPSSPAPSLPLPDFPLLSFPLSILSLSPSPPRPLSLPSFPSFFPSTKDGGRGNNILIHSLWIEKPCKEVGNFYSRSAHTCTPTQACAHTHTYMHTHMCVHTHPHTANQSKPVWCGDAIPWAIITGHFSALALREEEEQG